MNFVQQLEECLRDLAAEARKNHPGVKEASERATLKLRALKNTYVSEVRKATRSTGHHHQQHPTTKLFQSSDLLHPFLLAANYPNATTNLLEISFRAMRLLMEADAIVPGDGLNLVRVWMIQAQVVAAYYQKHYGKELQQQKQNNAVVGQDDSSGTSTTASQGTATATGATTNSASVTSSSSSSWFSWGSSLASSSHAATTSATATTAQTASGTSTSSSSSSTEAPKHHLSVKNAVSSSSGQTGQGSQSSSPAVMERLATEILSCLLQLVELLKSYPDHLTSELWTNAVALACLWLDSVPARHKVQQAAQATTIQVLTLLYKTNSTKLVDNTWEDLLSLISSNNGSAKRKAVTFTGAFVLCRKTSPSREFALELMSKIWREGSFQPEDKMFLKTLSITISLLQQTKLSVEMTLRAYQFSLAVFLSRVVEYPDECRELFSYLIRPVAIATDACRSHHDFEDGYVYTQQEAEGEGELQNVTAELNGSGETGTIKPRGEKLASFFPKSVLWKAGFAVEAVYTILEKPSPQRTVLMEDKKIIGTLAESLSHFATIGASCRDHILQVVDFCNFQSNAASRKPTVLRKAELVVLTGDTLSFGDSTTSKGSEKGSATTTSPVLGEVLWTSYQCLLCIADSLEVYEHPEQLLEETFAPFLAILQHHLKRFVGSKELVELSLRGYTKLGNVCLPRQECSMQRKALLTSLAKLSLPSWGKHDASCQLEDHHIRSLVCLLKLVHKYYESLSSEWDLILWTLQELSILLIASPLLSDEAYHSALALSAVFERFATFSTCFSDDCFIKMMEALTDICQECMKDWDIIGDSETVLPEKSSATVEPSEKKAEGRETISGKIMSIGVKAIYGSSSHNDSDKPEITLPSVVRTKHVFCEDYRKSFVGRVNASKHSVRMTSIGRLPFALTLLADLAIANSFRSKECNESTSAQLSRLAASTTAVRPFVMDIMTLLILSQLTTNDDKLVRAPAQGKVVFDHPMLSQLLASEPLLSDEKVEKHMPSHVDVLSPLCETIRSTERSDVAESALGVLNMVLQGSGHMLNEDVWPIIIESVSSLSGDKSYKIDRSKPEWVSCSLLAFQCLKLIVDDFLDELPSTGRQDGAVQECLLDGCAAFVSSKHDINTSLTAVGLLWSIADRDSRLDSIDLVLSTLVRLSSDSRAEARNAVVNTLFSFIVGRGGNFSSSRWKSCFTSAIFGLYDIVAIHANSKLPEPSKSSNKRESRYRLSLHHSRDSANKQWLATQVLVLRGLMRVLRSFFRELLDSTDDDSDDSDVPWFQDAWVQILDFAIDAAQQNGDRESLDIRSVGVELLGICCQLTSKAGIHAAAAPARVGTNMEVVNGALRSVRESQTSKPPLAHSHSMATDLIRQRLFLEAFESLESYRDAIEETRTSKENFPDDTDLQVLQKFCFSLSSIYECCKNDELKATSSAMTSLALKRGAEEERSISDESLESRFIGVIMTMLNAASNTNNVRFLNQSQRSAVDMLRAMVENGSQEALYRLVSLGKNAFFVRKDQESVADESESGEVSVPILLGALNHEAASIVSDALSKKDVSDEFVVSVLCRILVSFSKEFPDNNTANRWRKRHFKRLVPVIKQGLTSASKLSKENMQFEQDITLLWKAFNSFLSLALTPIPLSKDLAKIPRVTELLEIIEAAVQNVPKGLETELGNVLSVSFVAAFKTAEQHAPFAEEHAEQEVGRKSKKQRDELMQLCRSSFESSCFLGPEEPSLREAACSVLSDALSKKDKTKSEKDTFREISQIICSVIREQDKMHTLVISLFPILSKLVASEDDDARSAATSVFSSVDISGILDEARERYEAAEKRAEAAEDEAKNLSSLVEELRKRNEKLQREVAVLEASAAL